MTFQASSPPGIHVKNPGLFSAERWEIIIFLEHYRGTIPILWA
jgi:hypothetical protein